MCNIFNPVNQVRVVKYSFGVILVFRQTTFPSSHPFQSIYHKDQIQKVDINGPWGEVIPGTTIYLTYKLVK